MTVEAAGVMRSWFDVNWFSRRVLRPSHPVALLVSACLLGVSVLAAVKDYRAGAAISFLFGVISLVRELFPMALSLFTAPAAVLRTKAGLVEELAALQPSLSERKAGSEVIVVPHRDEPVLRSDRVDAWLREGHIRWMHDAHARARLDESLRLRNIDLEAILRCRYRESLRSVPRRLFVNDPKLCLLTAPTPDQTHITGYQASYFHSVVTNEVSTRVLEATNAYADVLFDGEVMYPASNGALHALEDSRMANHIGVSTLAITQDRKLILWNQAGSAQQSRDLLAPSGSGSCDAKDLENIARRSPTPHLNDVLAAAMERELREESSLVGVAGQDMHTQVMGYYRWLRRGGKPEFVGITRVPHPATALRPNAAEVNAPSHSRSLLLHDADGPEALAASAARLLEGRVCSVPLWVNLTVLLQVLQHEPDRLAFLWAD